MKKPFSPSTLMAAALLAAVSSTPVFAADGTITFTGQITDVTCTITGGANTDAGSGDITVNLPTISKSSLAENEKAGYTVFEVLIAGGGSCADGIVASMHYEVPASPQVDPVTGNLKNAGLAKNVQVGLLNNLGQRIDIYRGTNKSTATLDKGTATLTYTAFYEAVGGDADAGDVSTNVVYSMSYN